MLTGLAIAAFWAHDIWNDRQATVEILNETSAYDEWDNRSHENMIFTISPTDEVKVLRIRFGKDFMAAKIRKNNDMEGWIRSNSKSTLIYWHDET